MKKAIIITLAIMLIGGFVLFSRHHNQQANEPLFREVKNASSIKTAGVEQEMQTECTKAFKENGERLNDKCNDLIHELYERGFKVIKYEDGTFEMRLDV